MYILRFVSGFHNRLKINLSRNPHNGYFSLIFAVLDFIEKKINIVWLNIAPNQPKLQLRKTITEPKTATRIHKQISIHAIMHFSVTVNFCETFFKIF